MRTKAKENAREIIKANGRKKVKVKAKTMRKTKSNINANAKTKTSWKIINKLYHFSRKKIIFFDLEYWKTLLVQHNLDKNVCDSIIGTLLNIPGKKKKYPLLVV